MKLINLFILSWLFSVFSENFIETCLKRTFNLILPYGYYLNLDIECTDWLESWWEKFRSFNWLYFSNFAFAGIWTRTANMIGDRQRRAVFWLGVDMYDQIVHWSNIVKGARFNFYVQTRLKFADRFNSKYPSSNYSKKL